MSATPSRTSRGYLPQLASLTYTAGSARLNFWSLAPVRPLWQPLAASRKSDGPASLFEWVWLLADNGDQWRARVRIDGTRAGEIIAAESHELGYWTQSGRAELPRSYREPLTAAVATAEPESVLDTLDTLSGTEAPAVADPRVCSVCGESKEYWSRDCRGFASDATPEIEPVAGPHCWICNGPANRNGIYCDAHSAASRWRTRVTA